MITYEDLKRLRYYDAAIAAAEERKADLRRKAEGLTRSLSGMPRSNAHTDKMAEYMVKLEAMEQDLCKQITDMINLENRVRDEIGQLPYQQALVMNYRYLTFRQGRRLGWREVSRRTQYSVAHCKTIHRVAVRNLCGEGKEGKQNNV